MFNSRHKDKILSTLEKQINHTKAWIWVNTLAGLMLAVCEQLSFYGGHNHWKRRIVLARIEIFDR